MQSRPIKENQEDRLKAIDSGAKRILWAWKLHDPTNLPSTETPSKLSKIDSQNGMKWITRATHGIPLISGNDGLVRMIIASIYHLGFPMPPTNV